MTVETVEMFKLVCDYEQCQHQTIDHDECAAYTDADSVLSIAGDSEWHVEGDKHYCPCHAVPWCDRCDEQKIDALESDGETLCAACRTGGQP